MCLGSQGWASGAGRSEGVAAIIKRRQSTLVNIAAAEAPKAPSLWSKETTSLTTSLGKAIYTRSVRLQGSVSK